MTSKEIKQEAKKAFDSGNYQLAFTKLAELSAEEFLLYAEKNVKKIGKTNWFIDKNSAPYFWNEFINIEFVFDNFCNSENVIQLLHNYFSRTEFFNKEFELKLAKQNPQIYIEAVRVNLVFLCNKRKDFLQTIDLPEELLPHQKVWKLIYEEEKESWANVLNCLQSIKNLSLNEVFGGIHAFVSLNIDLHTTEDNDYHVSQIFSFAMELMLKGKTSSDLKNVTDKEMYLSYIEYIETKNIENTRIYGYLLAIHNWLILNEEKIQRYAYELEVTPIFLNEIVLFHSSPKYYYNWKVDELRYKEMRWYYDELSRDLMSKNGVEIKNENSKLLSSRMLFQDLCLENLYSNSSGFPDKLNDIFLSVLTFKTLIKNSNKKRRPFIFFGKDTYHANNILLFIPQDKFDKFNRQFDVYEQPFIALDDNFLCPLPFFEGNDLFYTLTQVALKMHRRPKKETDEMENYLTRLFVNKGWKSKRLDDDKQLTNTEKGDIDIVVEDGNSQILIQLKRTYFRLTTKQSYHENMLIDQSGAKQLNNGIQYVQENRLPLNIQKNSVKWLVSTSFENVGSEIYGCRKVNYFDIIQLLNDEEVNSVADLIHAIETDVLLYNFIREGYVDPISFEAKLYNAAVSSINLDKTRSDYKNYDFARKLYERDRKLEALETMQTYISNCSWDGEAYGFIANIYSDLQEFKMARIYFEKALERLPDDPFISRNFAISLLESKEVFEGLVLLKKTARMYPFYQDLQVLFDNKLESMIIKQLLRKDEILWLES